MKWKINPLLKATVFYIGGNGIGQGIMLLSTMIFTRVMTQGDYGAYSTYYSVVSVLTTVVGANLFMGLNSAYIDYKGKIDSFRASVLILSSIVCCLLTLIIVSGKIIFKSDISYFLILFAVMHAYAFFVINYFNNSANMENRYQLKTILLICPNVLQVLLSVVFIYVFVRQGLYARVAGSAIGVAICAICVYAYMVKGKSHLINKEFWLYSLKISVPSVLSSTSSLLMQQCDNIMITKFYGAKETAVYALIYNVGYILYAVLQATSGVWQAWLYRALGSGVLQNVKKAQKWYLFIFAQMAFALYMIAPELVKLLAPRAYWDFRYVAPFIIGSCLMAMYSFYTTIGNFYKKTGKVSLCVFIAAMVNVILNYLFIPWLGGVAAAYTSVFSYAILFLLSRKLGNTLKKGVFSERYFLIFILAVVGGGVLFLAIYPYTLVRYGTYILLLALSLSHMIKRKEEILCLMRK